MNSTEDIKTNFESQLADTEKQIAELEKNLIKAKEYKLKLQGGLETLALLEPKDETLGETVEPEKELLVESK